MKELLTKRILPVEKEFKSAVYIGDELIDIGFDIEKDFVTISVFRNKKGERYIEIAKVKR